MTTDIKQLKGQRITDKTYIITTRDENGWYFLLSKFKGEPNEMFASVKELENLVRKKVKGRAIYRPAESERKGYPVYREFSFPLEVWMWCWYRIAPGIRSYRRFRDGTTKPTWQRGWREDLYAGMIK